MTALSAVSSAATSAGDSCFPRDSAAIRAAARKEGYEPAVLEAAGEVNERQPERLVDLIATHVDLEGARITVVVDGRRIVERHEGITYEALTW